MAVFPLIDIRDTVNYKEVMKQYNLGPNGGIVTSLNLFATRFDQVMSIIDKRTDDCKLAIIIKSICIESICVHFVQY